MKKIDHTTRGAVIKAVQTIERRHGVEVTHQAIRWYLNLRKETGKREWRVWELESELAQLKAKV